MNQIIFCKAPQKIIFNLLVPHCKLPPNCACWVTKPKLLFIQLIKRLTSNNNPKTKEMVNKNSFFEDFIAY